MEKILVVEDEEPISDLIELNLSMAGYEITQAFDGEEGLRYINNENFDLILLDILLPKIDGYELMKHAVSKKTPVIFLTAKTSLKDKVFGLNSGADDYITKPFEGSELVARVKSVLRRAGKEEKLKTIGDIQIFYDSRKVFESGEEIELTAKEYELLEYLVENAGIALSREKLLEKVWDYDFSGNTRTVDMHIQRLRSKLDSIRIDTVYKMGYRLEA